MNEEAAFLKAIKKNPKDRTARLVFADWLQERDDPRAAWVRDNKIWEWMKPDAKDPRPALVQAAKRGDEAALDLLPRFGGHAIPTIIAAMKSAGRNQAFLLRGVLDEIGTKSEAVLPYLLEAARDTHPRVRGGAMQCLSFLVAENKQARDCLFAALKSKNADVRQSAACRLDEVGPAGAPAVPDLIRLLRKSEVVSCVTRALASIGPAAAPALPELVALFVRHGSAHCNTMWLSGTFKGIGAPSAAALLNVAGRFKGERFDELVSELTEIGAAAIPELRKAAKHKDATARLAAKEALARLSPESSVELLCGSNPEVIRRTLHHLWIHEEEAAPAAPALIELLADTGQPDDFRESAARILSRVGKAAEPAVPVFVASFPGANSELAQRMSVALDELGRVATATLLWLQRKPENRRRAEIEASRIRRNLYGGDRELATRDELAKIASRVRRPPALVEVVNAAFSTEPVPPLKAALSNESEDVRLVAVIGLWHVGTTEAVTALKPALKDTSRPVRAQAAQALEQLAPGTT